MVKRIEPNYFGLSKKNQSDSSTLDYSSIQPAVEWFNFGIEEYLKTVDERMKLLEKDIIEPIESYIKHHEPTSF